MNTMLKIDVKICNQYKPGITVKYYHCTPSKMIRTIQFEDDTWMCIETDESDGSHFSLIQKYAVMCDCYVDVLERHVDKQGRTIRIYKTLPMIESIAKLSI